jgi:acyl-CoA synthetase (AMP-forming)/AMP-acid ligase II
MSFLLHHLLIESAQRYPEKEAVRFEGQTLTYAELDGLTNQLARTLWAAGVRRGDGLVFMHKSLASVIGVFGIMKAGGAYVPLDPNAPAKRLAYITVTVISGCWPHPLRISPIYQTCLLRTRRFRLSSLPMTDRNRQPAAHRG